MSTLKLVLRLKEILQSLDDDRPGLAYDQLSELITKIENES